MLFLTIVAALSSLLSLTSAAAVSTITQTSEAEPGPICTLVDGGETGGTFCNVWDGTGTVTNTNWVTTVTPWLTSSSTSISNQELGPTVTTEPTSASASPTSTGCGEVGTFEIDFDDLPVAGIPSNASVGPPIFSPSDHFFWGASWTYGPPPTELYRPQSGDRLGHSVSGAISTVEGSPQAGTVPGKGFGAGPRNFNDFYWFHMNSAYVQCDFSSAGDAQQCDFTATAYQYNPDLKEDRVVSTQHWAQVRCNEPVCRLNQIVFAEPFRNLSAVSFYGVINGNIVDFYMDSVQLDWYNNSCEAGLARISSRK